MSIVMNGIDVAKAMKEDLIKRVEALKENNVNPCLAIVRVGDRPDDLSYERGALKRMELVGIDSKVIELPEDINQDAFEEAFKLVNDDPDVHGILLFRPLPKHLDEEPVKTMINPVKDVDCMSSVNFAKVFCGDDTGYAPCTPEAVMEMLAYNQIDLKGKRVVIVGRSMVVGKPLAMLMLQKHATVTIAHSRTADLAATCREAEVLVAAVGRPRMITEDMVGGQAVVVDVGINVDEEGKLCGDVDFEHVEAKASYISPVPRGVGSVTTSVLAKHVVRAAEYLHNR
jgi:methylenetetrahydrofolate dehydrogenase (NADP+)/methenyltetrahydrofolate cyclohydrolase